MQPAANNVVTDRLIIVYWLLASFVSRLNEWERENLSPATVELLRTTFTI